MANEMYNRTGKNQTHQLWMESLRAAYEAQLADLRAQLAEMTKDRDHGAKTGQDWFQRYNECSDVLAAEHKAREEAERNYEAIDGVLMEERRRRYAIEQSTTSAQAELEAIIKVLDNGAITSVGASFSSIANAVEETIYALRRAEEHAIKECDRANRYSLRCHRVEAERDEFRAQLEAERTAREDAEAELRSQKRARIRSSQVQSIKGEIQPVLVGALKSAINAHGPITLANLSGATKRLGGEIAGRIQALHENLTDVVAERDALAAEVEVLRTVVEEARGLIPPHPPALEHDIGGCGLSCQVVASSPMEVGK